MLKLMEPSSTSGDMYRLVPTYAVANNTSVKMASIGFYLTLELPKLSKHSRQTMGTKMASMMPHKSSNFLNVLLPCNNKQSSSNYFDHCFTAVSYVFNKPSLTNHYYTIFHSNPSTISEIQQF